MCTSIAMKTGDFYFGRNMDWDREFGEHIVVTPRNYPFRFRKAGDLPRHYALLGMAGIAGKYPLYADAVNEKGLCMAGLNFQGNARYSQEMPDDKTNLAPFELIPWLLGQCADLSEAKRLLAEVNVADIPFDDHMPPAMLHWHIADRSGSVVLEVTESGMHIYDDPVNVLTNNPPFGFHMTNLSQYLNLTVEAPENVFCTRADVRPFGKGLGSFGLPGDFSPASRFVKAAYLLLHSQCGAGEENSVSQFFHLLDAVAVVNGSIAAEEERNYYTTYTACMNADKGIYYYKTYFNSQVTAIRLRNENLEAACLKEYPLRKQPCIRWENERGKRYE